ncbi:hypothetical protein QO010_002638 [Caulobacter ginsengisoli]|uniref:Uncharacterized protein n=1 Tax=Caulobacter ginsengisoli TaxID=400775 RepID=A0ABU0IS92_9CAUL|nr:hypothetical protein [Caulobacter ginsengisoli]MDQ0464854.1 hypothetical protein [Caulobacter ginsengisoli]
MLKSALFAIIATAAGIAGAAQATPADQPATRSCFFINQWRGWSAPDNQTLLLKVGNRDVYKVTLTAGGSASINWPGVHLVSQVRGSNSVCSARDLDLSVSDSNGFREPLFLGQMTKLSPEEVAALAPRDRP